MVYRGSEKCDALVGGWVDGWMDDRNNVASPGVNYVVTRCYCESIDDMHRLTLFGIWVWRKEEEHGEACWYGLTKWDSYSAASRVVPLFCHPVNAQGLEAQSCSRGSRCALLHALLRVYALKRLKFYWSSVAVVCMNECNPTTYSYTYTHIDIHL